MPETTTARYRKKPVVVDAMPWDGTAEGATPIIDWILAGGGTARWHEHVPERRAPNGELSVYEVPTHIAVATLEGVMRASVGDWIIRGVEGEFYPCKPDIFLKSYDPADEPAAALPETSQPYATLLDWVARDHEARYVEVVVTADEPSYDEDETRLPATFVFAVAAHDGEPDGSAYVGTVVHADADNVEDAAVAILACFVDRAREVG